MDIFPKIHLFWWSKASLEEEMWKFVLRHRTARSRQCSGRFGWNKAQQDLLRGRHSVCCCIVGCIDGWNKASRVIFGNTKERIKAQQWWSAGLAL